jgi:nucleotide-binding universal stress UspA family protein
MSKPILVGTDFNPDMPQVIEQGLVLARALGGHVVLVHAVEPIEDPDHTDADTVAFHERLIALAEEKMAIEREKWPGDVDLCTLIELGCRVEVMLRLIQERGALMMVMGTPFRGGPPVGIGLQLIARSPIPVVIVP